MAVLASSLMAATLLTTLAGVGATSAPSSSGDPSTRPAPIQAERTWSLSPAQRRRLGNLSIVRDVGIGVTAGSYGLNTLGSMGFLLNGSHNSERTDSLANGLGMLVPGIGPIAVGATASWRTPLREISIGLGVMQLGTIGMAIGGGIAHAKLMRQIEREAFAPDQSSFRVSPYFTPTSAGLGATGRF